MAVRKVSISAMWYIRRYSGYSGDSAEVSLRELMMENKQMSWSARCELSHKIAREFQARESVPNEALSVVIKQGEPVLKPLLLLNSSDFPFLKTRHSEKFLPANPLKQCSMSIAQVLTGLPPVDDSKSNLIERLTGHLIRRPGVRSLHAVYGPNAGESVQEFYEAIKFVVLSYDFNKVKLVCKSLPDKRKVELSSQFKKMDVAGMAKYFG